MNNYTAQQVTLGRAFINTILAAFNTRPAGALVVTPKLRLSNNPALVFTPDTTIATLASAECAYSGYTAGGIAATVSAPLDLSTVCQGVFIQGLFEATPASPFVPDTATGWWLDDGTNFLVGEKFSGNQTAPFGVPGNFLALNATIPVQLNQGTS